MIPSGTRSFGVDAGGIAAFADTFSLTETERQRTLPFFIGVEALIRVEKPGHAARKVAPRAGDVRRVAQRSGRGTL